MTALPQNMQALAYANEIRIGAMHTKKYIRGLPSATAARKVAEALTEEHDDHVIGSIQVRRLLTCIRGLGEEKTTTCLIAAGVQNFERRIRDMPEKQRNAVAMQLLFWAERRRK